MKTFHTASIKLELKLQELIPVRNSELLNNLTPLWFSSIKNNEPTFSITQHEITFQFRTFYGCQNATVFALNQMLNNKSVQQQQHTHLLPLSAQFLITFEKFKHSHLWFQIIITKKERPTRNTNNWYNIFSSLIPIPISRSLLSNKTCIKINSFNTNNTTFLKRQKLFLVTKQCQGDYNSKLQYLANTRTPLTNTNRTS